MQCLPKVREGLADSLAECGVAYLLPSYVDMHGVPKGKVVPLAHFDQMMDGSELCTGAALDGVPQDIHEEEVSARPDPASAAILPWQRDVAWFASDLWCRGAPFEPCSRTILKRMLARYAALGYRVNFGMEAEFFVLRDLPDGGYGPVSPRHNLAKPAYDHTRLLDNLPWLGDLVAAMNELGWDVYSFDHEDGIGQFEIDFAYADALTMADRFVFFRRMADEIARRHGAFATFMPKPFADRAGSGAHYNISLADEAGRNLFADDADPRGKKLSALGYRFIAGVLRHLPAICAVVAPTVNSYKRLVLQGSMSGFTWAPVLQSYGGNNRTNPLRIPLAGGRVELRAADSACNPYLGLAMVLAAGLEGIEQGLDPGEPNEGNLFTLGEAELAARGIRTLPKSLGEALAAFETDPLSKAVMGEAMYAAWRDYKRGELDACHHHVSDWEKARYLKFY